MTDPDFSRSSGASAIGARLRRLSERIDRDAAGVYRAAGIEFEQRWYGVVALLSARGRMSVGDLASALGLSHASISQIRAGLDRAGPIAWDVDARNARLRHLRLTPTGVDRVRRLTPVWAALNQASVALNAEAGDALAAIDRLEAALLRQPLSARVSALLEN